MEENISAINKNKYLKVANLLYEKIKFKDFLLINIMLWFALSPSEILALSFEDFNDKNGLKSVHYYSNKKIERNDELFQMILWWSYGV